MSDNIKVVVKVRPLIARELEDNSKCRWRVRNNTLVQLDNNGRDTDIIFTFDKVYDKHTKTNEVYDDVAKSIVEAAIEGFNGTIFAYGQTSSGKTYTMTGTEDSPGIIPMAVLNLFDIIKNVPNRDFLVRVSYIEIYNETLRDLLNIDEEKKIKIHETPHGALKVDVTERVTSSPEEVLEAMKEGDANRQKAATNMNEESSRSHSIFQITIESREHLQDSEEVGCVNLSVLNLVDLAGSERAGQTGTTGIRFKEGTHINKSLSCLALVIKQLSEGVKGYVNFRDSKLTRILQNSIGGNAKTSIVCAITPAAVEETISTLQFANRAKSIKNKPEVNAVATNASMIQTLTKQLAQLQTELATKRNQLETKQNVELDLQKKINNLQKLILNGFSRRSGLDAASSKRKYLPPRRMTISTLHNIEEEPPADVPKFRTPALKYNPMVISADFMPISNSSKLCSLPEETRMVTPPPAGQNLTKGDEIINLDSDDDDVSDKLTCSPYHKCYSSSKTPPCVLRRNAKLAEKNLKDIVELTEIEKMYTPEVVELLDNQDKKQTLIEKLREEITDLNDKSKEKDLKIEELSNKVNKTEEVVTNLKLELETKCKQYNTQLTDWEVSYDALMSKHRIREQELLSLLEEEKLKNGDARGKALKATDRSLINFKDISKDISPVISDNESSSNIVEAEMPPVQVLIENIKAELAEKKQIITNLETIISSKNLKIDSLESSNQELCVSIEEFQNKLEAIEAENSFFKSTIDSLNVTVKNQKLHLETANKDIKLCNDTIQELQIKLTQKDKMLDISINENVLENLIASEEKLIANNDNIKNIIHSFKITLDTRNKEIENLKSSIQNNEVSVNIIALKEQIDNKDKQVSTLIEEAEKLKDQLLENSSVINKLMQVKDDLTNDLNTEQIKNKDLAKQNLEDSTQIEKLRIEIIKLKQIISEKEKIEQSLVRNNDEQSKLLDDMTKKVGILEEKSIQEENLVITQEKITKLKSVLNIFQNTLKLISGKDTYPEIIEIDDFELVVNDLNDKVHLLEGAAIALMNQKDESVGTVKELNMKLSLMAELHKAELEKLTHEMQQNHIDFANRTEELVTSVAHLNKQLAETEQNLESKINYIANIEVELNDARDRNESLLSDIYSKDQKISCLLENIKQLQTDKEAILDTYNRELLQNKNAHEDLIKQKDSQITLLDEKLSNLTVALESSNNEVITALRDSVKNRDKLFIEILKKTSKLTNNYNMEAEHCETDSIYEKIMLRLDEVANHIFKLRTENDLERSVMEKLLTAAKTELDSVTYEHIKVLSQLEEISQENNKLMIEMNRITSHNKELTYLCESMKETLVEGRSTSQKEIETLKKEVVEWQNKLQTLENKMEDELKGKEKLMSDNNRLKELIEKPLNFPESYTNSLDDLKTKSPQSLKTLCFLSAINFLYYSDNDLPSSSSSNTEVHNIKASTQKHCSECECLTKKLVQSTHELTSLSKTLSQLENTCDLLLKEREQVRREIRDLVEPANELQKKVLNHRTNLSTLTATTYAENKLLNSQLKVLNHHHTRYINLCERDLPAFKTQLNELMCILRGNNCSFYKHNSKFKRCSLPDVLDSNASMCSNKNESTLDGDVLMLDTNVTLTTSADNTLTCHDQTCLEVTQINLENDNGLDNDLSKISDPYLITELETLRNDNLKLFEELQATLKENHKLKETLQSVSVQIRPLENSATNTLDLEVVTSCTVPVKDPCLTDTIKMCNVESSKQLEVTEQCNYNNDISTNTSPKSCKDAQSSPIKLNDVLTNKEHEFCTRCKEYEISDENLNKSIAVLSRTLEETKSQKNDLEQKYTQLESEIRCIDGLRRKLTNLEKDHQLKIQDITKIRSELVKKNRIVKELQDENDTLSTQVIDNVTEVDSLKEELLKVKDINDRLNEKCEQLETRIHTEIRCPHCVIKDEMINTLKKSQDHSKLNRSLSDSDSSSRLNKICTLQSELQASKEDCKKITEEVHTIKNQLERSNVSVGQAMDLDDSLAESNIFKFTKDFTTASNNKIRVSESADTYAIDKSDCFNYYFEKTGADKENLNKDIKILDIMKMLYNNLIAKHGNEVENLTNKLKVIEDSKRQLELEYSKVSRELQDNVETLKSVTDLTSKIKESTTYMSKELTESTDLDRNTKLVNFFKDNMLCALDSNFGLSLVNMFEGLIDSVVNKHQKDLTQTMEQYAKLQSHMENVVAEFNIVNENLKEMKCQLSEKELEYNLLKAQKEKIYEISNAVTIDIIKKEKILLDLLTSGYNKLVELDIIVPLEIDPTLSLSERFNILFECIINNKQTANLKSENNNLLSELNKLKTVIEEKEMTVRVLNDKLIQSENDLKNQKSLHEDLVKIYDIKVEENKANIRIIKNINDEIETLKNDLFKKDKFIQNLEDRVSKETTDKTIQNVQILKQEYDTLKSVNDMLHMEKEKYAEELSRANEAINKNKKELENMTDNILVLRESVNDNVVVIEKLTLEAKSLMQQNVLLKNQFDEKCQECARLEMNIKTHTKTAEIQSKIIIRLQKEKEDKEKQLQELTEKCNVLQSDCDNLKQKLDAAIEEANLLKSQKEALKIDDEACETNISTGRRSSVSRRRRQSMYDSSRVLLLAHDRMDLDDHFKAEAVFNSRDKPDDLFANNDEDSSARSTPIRLSRGRDSFPRQDQEEDASRPGSVAASASRRRRQSIHDAHRPDLDYPTRLSDGSGHSKPDILGGSTSTCNLQQLRSKLAELQQEMEELKERNKELDDECEICAQYLRERDEQCLRLTKEKVALENQLAELKNCTAFSSNSLSKPNVAHASVNTDADWANLHSVVVDRMSYDAEVEKNKKLSRTIEELRCSKQELKNNIAKMQRALEKHAGHKELEATRQELASCKAELEELQSRYRELDEECDTCARYLKERDEQCRALTQVKRALESKLQELQEGAGASVSAKVKRQVLHDAHRHAHTDTGDDLLSYQVARDDDNEQTQEMTRLKMSLDKVLKEKAALEKQLLSSSTPAPAPHVYVATGSAIVQNQQITDVLKENHKLKKMNAKLISICKKRGKSQATNEENEDPSEIG